MANPARQLNDQTITRSLDCNIIPLIKKSDTVTACRVMLNEEKRLLVTDLRHRLDGVLANMEIKFFISCISSTESNAKEKSTGQQRVEKAPFRVSITYFIVHGKTLNKSQIRQKFHNNTKMDFEIKPLRANPKASEKKDVEELIILAFLKQTVKDHNQKCIKDLITESILHCFKTANPSLTEEDAMEFLQSSECKPCRLFCADGRILQSFTHASRNLMADGLIHMNDTAEEIPLSVSSELPKTSILKVTEKIAETMMKLNHRLYRGYIYVLHSKARFTFVLFLDVKAYLSKLQLNPSLKEPIMLHETQLRNKMSDEHTEMYPKIRINYDYIEIRNNMYLKLSSREFVECPFSGDDFGKITPRTFQDFDPSRTTCHGGFLATAIERWCPTLEEQAQLAHKIYLCLLTYQIPYKSKRLVLSGDIDCGKTSVFNMFSGLIPRSKIAIITKEGAFGFSMIRPDTELVFIDEWTKETAPADMIKMVFQGGPFPQSIKFSDPNMQEMNAGIFATCNYVPKYKKKDKDSVERRIDEIKCRKLEVQSAEAPKWIRENTMHCLTYLINLINSNLNLIDESELTYTLPVDVKSKTTLPKEPVDEETIQKIMNCVVEADDSVPLAGSPPKELEVFRVIEEDMQVESELELHESDSELELHESDLELKRHESECVEQYDESVLDEPCITMNEFAERPMTNDKIDAESLIGFISTTDVDSDIEPPKKRARKLWLNSPQPESDAEIVQILLERLVQNVSSNDVDASTTSITTTSGMSTQNANESPVKEKVDIKYSKRFKLDRINDLEYWQLVRAFIQYNLGFRTLNDAVAFSLFQTYDKFKASMNSPRPPTTADPKIDASLIVINKVRPDFDLSGFLTKYPSCVQAIKRLRKKIGVSYNSSIL